MSIFEMVTLVIMACQITPNVDSFDYTLKNQNKCRRDYLICIASTKGEKIMDRDVYGCLAPNEKGNK